MEMDTAVARGNLVNVQLSTSSQLRQRLVHNCLVYWYLGSAKKYINTHTHLTETPGHYPQIFAENLKLHVRRDNTCFMQCNKIDVISVTGEL